MKSTPWPPSSTSWPNKHRRRVLVAASLLAIIILLFAGAFARALNHDEEQFIAPPALLLHHGLLPYRDYPCFHTPDLIFVFAALFATTTHYLLAARTFNAFCAALLLLLLFAFTVRRFRAFPERNWLVGSGFALLLGLNPFFRFTAGRAWNHDLAVLALIASFLAFLQVEKSAQPGLWLALSGAGVGLAAGTRLSFAPMVAPLALAVLLFPMRGRNRIVSLTTLGGGVAVALLPVVVLFSLAPHQFIFDNFTYNGAINLLYREATVPRKIAFWNKFGFPFQYFLRSPSDILLLGGFVCFALRPWWRGGRAGWRNDRELSLLVLLLPFLFIGSWAPTPSYRQYYYPFVPFLLLGNIIGLARARPSRLRTLRLLWLTVIVSLLEALPSFSSSLGGIAPSTWPVFSVHEKAEAIAALLPRGRVLTLAPIFPLEAGREIYPAFATGPFAWRTASFIDPGERAVFGFVAPDDLEGYLAADPPAAILTGFEHGEFEQPLLRYARRHGYLSHRLPTRGALWLPAD